MGQSTGLAGKSAVVVGSSGGWGEGVALALAREGVRVVINGTKPDAVKRVVSRIGSAGGDAIGCPVGVHTPEGAEELTAFARDQLDGIDILVNSTGGKVTGTIQELSAEAFDRSVDIQLKAPFLMTHCVANVMIESGTAGRIINMSGGAAVRPLYAESLHCATKGGLLAATWTWALELEPYGITVNAVRGGVRSPGTESLIARIRTQLGDNGRPEVISDRELGFFEAEEAAPLVVWLASELSKGITGQFVGIDGPKITIWDLPATGAEVHNSGGWSVDSLDATVKPLLAKATQKSRQETQVIDALKYVGADAGHDES
jgi:NAD(P)-dependent dehydrogenase (short-subunit alcohol dehydrogenase family)